MGREGLCLPSPFSFFLSPPGTRPKALVANRLKLLNGGVDRCKHREPSHALSQSRASWIEEARPFRIQGRGRPLSANCKIIGDDGDSRFKSRPRFSELSTNTDTSVSTTIHTPSGNETRAPIKARTYELARIQRVFTR